jgi:hypothetical protein
MNVLAYVTDKTTNVVPCGICGEQRGTGTGFSLNASIFPCQHHSTMDRHTLVSSGGSTLYLLVAAVQRHNLTPST